MLVLIHTFSEWLLRKFDAPIMRKRVNEASDEYLDSLRSPLDEGKLRATRTPARGS